MTALGNNLAAASHTLAGQPGLANSRLTETLERSFGQWERASEAHSRFSDIFRVDAVGR